jgi:RecB family endonuclease NucS
MRIIIANCEVTYQGRGYTELPLGVRAIMIKADGAVSIHADYNGNKPLNYMSSGNQIIVEEFENHSIWKFVSKKESIEVTIHDILSETNFELAENEPGLDRQRTEKDLQKFISEKPSSIMYFYNYKNTKRLEVIREYNTKAAGAVDLLILDRKDKKVYIVEVKRVAMLGAVDQCRRYLSAYSENPIEGTENFTVLTAIAARDIRPNTLRLAEKHNIDCILIKEEPELD